MNFEEEKQLFPQEYYIKQQLTKQAVPLQHQRENLKEYSLAENHLINKIIVSDSFNKQSSSYES